MAKHKRKDGQKTEAAAESSTTKKWPGVWGMWQWFLGAEPGRSFGTALLILCLLVPISTALSVNALILSAAFGKIKLQIALTLLRVLLGWPVIALNIFLGCLGFVIHLLRKKRDLEALKELSSVVERVYLASDGKVLGKGSLPNSVHNLLQGAMAKVGASHLAAGSAVTLPGLDQPAKLPTLK